MKKEFEHILFAERLRDLRQESNLSQAQLAEKVGCSQPMIVLWEKGSCEPTASYIVKLSDIFNCSTDYLLGKED